MVGAYCSLRRLIVFALPALSGERGRERWGSWRTGYRAYLRMPVRPPGNTEWFYVDAMVVPASTKKELPYDISGDVGGGEQGTWVYTAAPPKFLNLSVKTDGGIVCVVHRTGTTR